MGVGWAPVVPRSRAPGLSLEKAARAEGHRVVVGLDEVGRGSWAGPLTVGAVVLPEVGRVNGIRDSKMLTPERRQALYGRILDWVEAWAVGHASASECDGLGMSAAQRLAASRALAGLGVVPDLALVDGSWNFVEGCETRTIIGGDAVCLSIATASILAKVTRDREMIVQAEHYPHFGFDGNKGYPAPVHTTALVGYGPCPIHRRSWSFMDSLPWNGVRRYHRGCGTPLF